VPPTFDHTLLFTLPISILAKPSAANTILPEMKFLLLASLAALTLAGCASPASKDPFAATAPAPPPPAKKPKYDNPYSIPLSTPGARFGTLPPIVQNTVRSEAGTAEIIDVRKEKNGERVYYKITFRESRNFPPLLVGSDGSVLNPDLTVAVPSPMQVTSEIKLADCPYAVGKSIQEHAGSAEIASINQEHWGDHTVYVVSFKDEAKHSKMYIIADGTMMIPAGK
jgi:hypothetical protein